MSAIHQCPVFVCKPLMKTYISLIRLNPYTHPTAVVKSANEDTWFRLVSVCSIEDFQGKKKRKRQIKSHQYFILSQILDKGLLTIHSSWAPSGLLSGLRVGLMT